jgi:hypothetical protein
MTSLSVPIVGYFPNTKKHSAAFRIPCDTNHLPYGSPSLPSIVVYSVTNIFDDVAASARQAISLHRGVGPRCL